MRSRNRSIVCADKVTAKHFGLWLIHVAGFGWQPNPVTKMSAGVFSGPKDDCAYAIDWDESYGGVFVIPDALHPLFRDFCAGAPITAQRVH